MNGAHPRTSRRSRLRFSMLSLLVILTCVCCFLAGDRFGYRRGLARWDSMPLYMVVYTTRGLMGRAADGRTARVTLDDLATRIKQEVAPSAWEDAGGNCRIMPLPSKGSFLVKANQYVHDELQKFLRHARDKRMAAVR